MKNGDADIIILLILVAFAALLFILNVGINRIIINVAIKKYVIPDLNKKGFTSKGYESTGIFSVGDFTGMTNSDMPVRLFFSKNGSPTKSSFYYIYYNTGDGNKRITVRIDTLFFSVQKVKYSSEL